MSTKWRGQLPDWIAPATKAAAVTPTDSDLAAMARGIYVGTGGDVALLLADDTSPVVFKNVPAGSFLPFACKQVRATNTTASDIVAVS